MGSGAQHFLRVFLFRNLQTLRRRPKKRSDVLSSSAASQRIATSRKSHVFVNEDDSISSLIIFISEMSNSNAPKPRFVGSVRNRTAPLGREAILECSVENLGNYKVGETDFKGKV